MRCCRTLNSYELTLNSASNYSPKLQPSKPCHVCLQSLALPSLILASPWQMRVRPCPPWGHSAHPSPQKEAHKPTNIDEASRNDSRCNLHFVTCNIVQCRLRQDTSLCTAWSQTGLRSAKCTWTPPPLPNSTCHVTKRQLPEPHTSFDLFKKIWVIRKNENTNKYVLSSKTDCLFHSLVCSCIVVWCCMNVHNGFAWIPHFSVHILGLGWIHKLFSGAFDSRLGDWGEMMLIYHLYDTRG